MTDALIQAILTPIVDSGIKALASRIGKFSSTHKEKREIIFKLEEYYRNSFIKCSIAHTILINSSQRMLSDIYIPLTIESKSELNKSILINRFPEAEFSNLKYILIEDSAGMGKSTISKVMYLNLIAEGKMNPILLELRKIKKDYSLTQIIANEIFNSLETKFINEVEVLLKNNNTVVFLDGYDEIGLDVKEHVTKEIINTFITTGLHSVVLTSRSEDGLLPFVQFHKFRIKEFEYEEAIELIKRIDISNKIADSLIEKITQDQYSGIIDYLKNPLLTTLLFNVYDVKREIPLKKHLFYREIYITLFERHDLSKEHFIRKKYSNLDIEDFQLVLKYLGYYSLKKSIVEYEEQELYNILTRIREKCLLSFSPILLVKDLTETVPLFVRDGQSIRWVHKSLMEYFTSLYIYSISNNKKSAFNAISSTSGLENLMDIYYDLDLKGFEEIFIDQLVSTYIEFRQSVLNHLPNLEKKEFDNILELLTFNGFCFNGFSDNIVHKDRFFIFDWASDYFSKTEFKGTIVCFDKKEIVSEQTDFSDIFIEISDLYFILNKKNYRLLKGKNVIDVLDDSFIDNLSIYGTSLIALTELSDSELAELINFIKYLISRPSVFKDYLLFFDESKVLDYYNKMLSRNSEDSDFD